EASPLTVTSSRASSAAMRLNATTNCSVVFARMTPRLAERLRGFSTQGNSTPRAASTGFSPRAMRLNRGTGTPAAARHWRIWNLSRAAATASVRYGRVGRSSSSRALPPTEDSGLAGGVVGVRPLRVVGRVEHLGDLRKLFLDEALDARLERDVRGAAALAAAAHGQVDAV